MRRHLGTEYIVFAGAKGPLYKVSVNGGTAVPVTVLDGARPGWRPSVLIQTHPADHEWWKDGSC